MIVMFEDGVNEKCFIGGVSFWIPVVSCSTRVSQEGLIRCGCGAAETLLLLRLKACRSPALH
jgi:hypothetical protein